MADAGIGPLSIFYFVARQSFLRLGALEGILASVDRFGALALPVWSSPQSSLVAHSLVISAVCL
jgi:hypothetical protein